jgi:hypothetical protein
MQTTTTKEKNTEQVNTVGPAALTLARQALAEILFALALLGAALVLWLVLLAVVGAAPALAQQGGGGDAIQATLANVRDYIAGLLLLLGGIGFVVSLGLKAASPINENAQYLSNMGMKSSFIAVLGGAIVGPVMDIIQGLAGA